MRHTFCRFFGVFSLIIVLVLTLPAFGAFDDFDDFGGDPFSDDFDDVSSPAAPSSQGAQSLIDSSLSEQEQIDLIASSLNFKFKNPDKDPFKPMIIPKPQKPRVRTPPPTTQSRPKPAPPPVEPLRLSVSGIVGNEQHRVAVIRYKNNNYTVTRDKVVEGKFKVVDIHKDRIVVYSNEEQRRHTFRMGSE